MDNQKTTTETPVAQAATPTPWTAHPTSSDWWDVVAGEYRHNPSVANVFNFANPAQAAFDAKLICRAVNAHDALLSAVEKAQAVIATRALGQIDAGAALTELAAILDVESLWALVNEAKAGAEHA